MMLIRANQLNSSGNVNPTLAALKRASKLQQLLVCIDSVLRVEQGCLGLCASVCGRSLELLLCTALLPSKSRLCSSG